MRNIFFVSEKLFLADCVGKSYKSYQILQIFYLKTKEVIYETTTRTTDDNF